LSFILWVTTCVVSNWLLQTVFKGVCVGLRTVEQVASPFSVYVICCMQSSPITKKHCIMQTVNAHSMNWLRIKLDTMYIKDTGVFS